MRDKSHKDPHEPQGISTLLSGMARDQGWQLQLDRHSLFLHWNTLVDKSTCAHAQPLKIVGNVLWLEVANSLSRLEDIRFTLVDHEKAKEQNKQKVRFMQPNPAAREAFEKQIAGIEDEKIRDSLMSLWYLSHSCQKC